MGQGFASLLARLPAGQALQVHVQATPVALDRLVADYRAQVELALAPIESRAPARAAALRELAEVHVESLHVHAAEHAAVRVRYLLVVPVSEQTGKGWAGALARSRTHGRVGLARVSLALVDALRSELEALDMGVRMLDGPEVADVLFGRFAPAISADQPALAPSRRPTILSAGPTAEDQELAARAAAAAGRGDRPRGHRRVRPPLAERRRRSRADDLPLGLAGRDVLRLAAARHAVAEAVDAVGPRPRARPRLGAPALPPAPPKAVRRQPRGRVGRPRAGLRPARPRGRGRRARLRAHPVGDRQPVRRRGLPDAPRAGPGAGPGGARRGGRAGDRRDPARRRRARRPGRVPPARPLALEPPARARRRRRRRAATRPSTRPTRCRWSARAAARRPASTSATPTPAARSSASTRSTRCTTTAR